MNQWISVEEIETTSAPQILATTRMNDTLLKLKLLYTTMLTRMLRNDCSDDLSYNFIAKICLNYFGIRSFTKRFETDMLKGISSSESTSSSIFVTTMIEDLSFQTSVEFPILICSTHFLHTFSLPVGLLRLLLPSNVHFVHHHFMFVDL